MNILYVAQRVPEPPNKGDKIRAHHIARRLAERHAVHVACLLDDPADSEHARTCAGWAASVTAVQRRPAESAVRGAAAAVTGRPMTSGYFRSGELARALDRLRGRERMDVQVSYCSGMAGYIPSGSGARVLDFVDVDSEKWREYAHRSRLPRRAVYALEHRLLRNYERKLADEFDRCIIISDEERDALARFADPSRVSVVSNGVDAEWLARTGPRPRGASLVFVGALDYFANVDGIVHFAREIFPGIRERVPGAKLRIVGRRPAPAVEALGDGDGVEVVGEVDDMRPEVWKASAAVVPLRIAPGVQNKILEAMAAGTPVVATRAALRSIHGRDGEHFLACDAPEEFAEAVATLERDPARGDAIARHARELVRSEYSWEARAREYETVLEGAVEEAGRGDGASR